MSRLNTTAWTCDQCGVIEDVAYGEQPGGWIGLAFFPTPEHAEPQGRRLHICKECAEGKGPEHALSFLHRQAAAS